jgi:hypothetical protein
MGVLTASLLTVYALKYSFILFHSLLMVNFAPTAFDALVESTTEITSGISKNVLLETLQYVLIVFVLQAVQVLIFIALQIQLRKLSLVQAVYAEYWVLRLQAQL